MMHKFENLLDTRKKLDEVLKIANEQESIIRKEIHDYKTAQYSKMWNDCMELREIAKQFGMSYIHLDTGIEVYNNVTVWLSFDSTKKIALSTAAPNFKGDYYYTSFYEQSNLYEMSTRGSYGCSRAVPHMERVLANWDEAFIHMQESLAEQAKKKMESDIAKAKQTQEELMEEYNKYCK